MLSVGAELELRTTLQHIVDGAAELTGARYAALGTTDPGQDGLTAIRTGGAEPPPAGVLSVPIHVHDEVFGHLHLAGKHHSAPFTAEDEQLLHVLAAQAGIAIGNARLYETARQRERWIEGAAAVTTALLTGERAADALATVAEGARALADAAAGVILQPTPAGGMEIVTASAHDDPGDFVGTTIAPGSPVLVQLLGGEPVFIDDSATDPRMTTHVRHRFGPSMMLPLQAEGRLIGTLALPRHPGDRPYTAVERLLATQFASQAALALVLADAQHSRERLAVYEDRDRIARDLHDLVVQRLFATGMMLESTQRRTAESDEAHDLLGRAVDELQSTVQEVRTAIFALQQPPAEAPTSLRGKVLRETATASAILGFAPSTHFEGAVDTLVPDRVATPLLTALRRAVTAASHRAGVSRLEITIDVTRPLPDGRGAVRLRVHDDGGTDGTTVNWQSPL
ncbi:GAF domain-containing protein [Streptomyces sp. NBC_01239]|uniref:sensor histidine kinase n=1 Tax=Streptomyces sp. NBC_01239 TaxID=2903792 RepID=UPI0022581883|nr:GAF domain-containing protein [Streptomyces sp. NBC_01239]MCX4810869.1 GAF domain-containing protein [Streptomyces sp. NBC_01239]